MCKCHSGLGFLFGAFLIVFTFVDWAPAKWVTFAIGIALVLHVGSGEKCVCKPKKAPKKKAKK